MVIWLLNGSLRYRLITLLGYHYNCSRRSELTVEYLCLMWGVRAVVAMKNPFWVMPHATTRVAPCELFMG